MHFTKESLRVLIIILFVIVNNWVKNELGIGQPRVDPELEKRKQEMVESGGFIMDADGKLHLAPVERNLRFIKIYNNELPGPDPRESPLAYSLYQSWKRRQDRLGDQKYQALHMPDR